MGSLQDELSALRKKGAKAGAFSDFDNTRPVGLTTGNIAIDHLTDIGGIPKGRITEIYGPPSSGKTTCALQTAARVQQSGGTVLFLDYEKSLAEGYCHALGLDVRDEESFIYDQPACFEDGANLARKLAATGELSLIIHDSVASMVTSHELEAATGAVQVADRAKMLNQYCRQLVPVLSGTGTAAIFLNHLLEKVDATPMGRQLAARGIKQYTTPGGKALPFYSSLRIEFKQEGNLKTSEFDWLSNEDSDQIRQTKTKVTVTKNKVGIPMRTAHVRIRFGQGFSQTYSVFRILESYGDIKKSTSWFSFLDPELRLDPDEPKIQGEEAVLKAMESNPAWAAKLEARAREILDGEEEVMEIANAEDFDA